MARSREQQSQDEKAAGLLAAWLAAVEMYLGAPPAFLLQHQAQVLASLTRMELLLGQPWTPSWSVPPDLVALVEALIVQVRQRVQAAQRQAARQEA